ncbi:hypothetical protein [Neobacillus sp. 19]
MNEKKLRTSPVDYFHNKITALQGLDVPLVEYTCKVMILLNS